MTTIKEIESNRDLFDIQYVVWYYNKYYSLDSLYIFTYCMYVNACKYACYIPMSYTYMRVSHAFLNFEFPINA